MGFGLLALGYIFLSFYTTGADLVGYIIMLFSFQKLSKVEKSFKKCIIAIAILIPVGMFNLFGFVDTAFDLNILRDYSNQNSNLTSESVESSDNSNISDEVEISMDVEAFEDTSSEASIDVETEARMKKVRIAEGFFNALFIFGSLCLHYFFYQSAKKLSISAQVPKLGLKANINMVINIIFFSVWGFLSAGGVNKASFIVTLLYFPVIIFNFIYIYSCYATYAFANETDSDENEND